MVLLSEPHQANLCLRTFRHDKFQLRMPSHSEGPGIWFSVWKFLLIHCLYERAAKVLARLGGCAGSPEPSLLAWAISTKFACRGPSKNVFKRRAQNDMSHIMRKPVYAICEQQRSRSAWAFAQSDQRLFCSLPRYYNSSSFYIQNFKFLPSFCGCAGQFESTLVANPEDRFSRNEAHIVQTLQEQFNLDINT